MKQLILLFTFSTLQVLSQQNKEKPSVSSNPFVLGLIDELPSKELNEKRTLNIYLPPGYDAKDTVQYPVIYLLDGSADEDFIHVVGLVQFYNFEWINKVPKAIVVGIATVDRRRDFTFEPTDTTMRSFAPTGGHSDNFIAFIEQELQPYIATKYRTNSDKTIIGQSLGGLLVSEVLLRKPTLFNRYIIVSPSLWWNNGTLLYEQSAILSSDFKQHTDIYIGVGKEGLTPVKEPRVMEVDANLLADKLQRTESPNVHVTFDYLPEEDHATIGHHAFSNGLMAVFKKVNR
ncbi:MAG: alpha/beta hydrolase [Flavobacteriia bacterium]